MLERIKTALILVIIVFLCLFITKNPTPMVLLMTIGGILTAYEWSNLIPNLKNPYIFIGFVTIINFVLFVTDSLLAVIWIAAMAVWVFAAYWVKVFPNKTSQWFDKYLLTYVGVVLITATTSSMFYLWGYSPWWLLYAMALGWCADTGAYFVGKKFGKHKLAPTVSPKKTYEGLFGGMAVSLIFTVIVAYSLDLTAEKQVYFLLLSMIGAGISVLGDLFESMIKRKRGVKDSGKLLPGHGGILDRIDSMMATLPIFAFGFMLFELYN